LKTRDQRKEQLEEQIQRYNTIHEDRGEAQSRLQETHQQLEQLTERLHGEDLKITEQRLQREQLEEQLLTEHGETPEALLQTLEVEKMNETEMAGKLRGLKTQLNAMAHVNLAAPEEYETLLERIELLRQQSDDLNHAIQDLEATIREINNESRRRFNETFVLINLHFQELFTNLFDGGEAKMILTDASDVLESGVDIMAQPPGKKLQNINLLSGGEKALTAISLIFAIFLIKPSPFCLLDEVDAPLDDANIGKFNRLIKQLTTNSQFIIITLRTYNNRLFKSLFR